MANNRQASRISNELARVAYVALAATGALGATSLAYATRVEPHWVEIVQQTLELPRLSRRFNGYRIAQISDLHAGDWIPHDSVAEAIELVNSLEPDLIAITGDYVTRANEQTVAGLAPHLGRLRARDGVLAILGNHDYYGRLGAGAVRQAIREAGMIDLNNRVFSLEREGAVLHIAGVDSARERMDRLDLVLSKLPHDGAAILLAHEPDFADVAAATGRFDLQLSGHSHGGQVVIPFAGPPHLPPMGRKYHTGRYQVKGMIQYTNRGIGTVGLPVRFWCRPEITLFTLLGGSRVI